MFRLSLPINKIIKQVSPKNHYNQYYVSYLDLYNKMSNLPLNSNNQSILNKWNTDKTDSGLTLKEIKNAADTNKDNKITVDELKAKGITPKEANRLAEKINNLNVADKFFSIISVKNNVDKLKDKLVMVNLFELDEKALPNGVSGVSVSDIQQGDRPTCYLLGATTSFTQQRPQDVLKLIDKNKDGTYTVTFPGLPETKKVSVPVIPGALPFAQPKVEIKNANKITVKAPTEDELKKFTHKGLDNSTWVAIIDKAYNQYCQNYGLKANYIPFYPKDKASDYGMPWEGVKALTGNKTEHLAVDLTRNSKIFDKLETALKDKRVVVACTIGKGDTSPAKGELRMSNAHVFGVMDVNKEKQTITVRDPYGDADYMGENKKLITDRSKDGFLELSIEKFNKYFTDIVIETNKKINS